MNDYIYAAAYGTILVLIILLMFISIKRSITEEIESKDSIGKAVVDVVEKKIALLVLCIDEKDKEVDDKINQLKSLIN